MATNKMFSYFILLSLISFASTGRGGEIDLNLPLLQKEQDYNLDGTIKPATPEEKQYFTNLLNTWFTKYNPQASRNLEWFDVDNFLNEVNSVNLILNRSDKAVVGSEVRSGSVYLTESKSILLNISLMSSLTSPHERTAGTAVGSEIALIHEYLGALGYPDDNYELSLYLWMQTFPEYYSPQMLSVMEETLGSHLQNNGRRLDNIEFQLPDGSILHNSGSSTVVGGGGDPASAAIKNFTLLHLSNNKKRIQQFHGLTDGQYNKLIKFIMTTSVEPITSPKHYRHDMQSLDQQSYIRIGTNARGQYQLEVDTAVVHLIITPYDTLRVGDESLKQFIALAKKTNRL